MNWRGKPAFTLIEVLLGAALFSIIALVLAGMLWGGVKLEASARGMARGSFAAQRALGVMARDLENAVVLDLAGLPALPPVCVGESGKMAFYTRRARGIVVVTYRLGELTADTRRLMRAEGRSKSESGAVKDRGRALLREEVLLKDLLEGAENTPLVEALAEGLKEGGLVFSYGALEKAGQPGVLFADRWQKVGLPAAVRVVLKAGNVVTLSRTVYLPTEYQSAARVERLAGSAGAVRYRLRASAAERLKDDMAGP
ncbi:MAG: prepilin-type N-terminal cleavage/methylation domain-containing protein [Candidatus Omnitrophica bacterium]|nr:prepilin-type N-terminal cleavage/methylation domain-containing protein [Candidatus Omnitrophota bacterium]